MLEEIKQTYIQFANNIPNWKTMNKNDLANLYLENEHKEPERSYYFSALMCRYWKHVYRFYKSSKSTRLQISDFTNWLAESFFVAFKYRRWKDPSSKLYNDPQAPDKVINRCIYSTRMRYYQKYNMDKRKVNYRTDSIERQLDSFGHHADVYDYLGVEDIDKSEEICKDIINYYISKGNILNAIVLDIICFHDSFQTTKYVSRTVSPEDLEYEKTFDTTDSEDSIELAQDLTIEDEEYVEKEEEKDEDDLSDSTEESEEYNKYEAIEVPKKQITYTHNFSPRKFMRILRNIDEDYINYFSDIYIVNKGEVVKCVEKIHDLDARRHLTRVYSKVIENISKDRKVKELLCL